MGTQSALCLLESKCEFKQGVGRAKYLTYSLYILYKAQLQPFPISLDIKSEHFYSTRYTLNDSTHYSFSLHLVDIKLAFDILIVLLSNNTTSKQTNSILLEKNYTIKASSKRSSTTSMMIKWDEFIYTLLLLLFSVFVYDKVNKHCLTQVDNLLRVRTYGTTYYLWWIWTKQKKALEGSSS